MTLWDIFDAWTDSALEAPARDNGTHAERIEELKDYTDACSYRDCWDCAPVTDEEAEKIVDCYENGGVNVNLSGSNMGAVIGRRGETLDAIQHLTNYAVNRGSDKHMHISVDAESYRAKREESLVRLAEKMAAKAVKYKRSMALEPMNSYERHVIHTALQDYEGVTTSSTGTEPNRRVVVSYEKPQRPSNKPVSREWS